jgi:magnesium-transporting ATPase (P-type)
VARDCHVRQDRTGVLELRSFSVQVTGVGMNTEWGRVMSTLNEDNEEDTPLQVRI